MAKTGVVLFKNKGADIPSEYLELAIAQNSTVMGAALVTVADNKPVIQIGGKADGVDLKAINAAQEAFKDSVALFFLGNSSDKVLDDDLQPYVVLDDVDGNPLMVAFLEGCFDNFHQAKSSHSDAFFVVNNYLIPTIKEIHDVAGGDMKKVLSRLRDNTIKLNMQNLWVGRGVITLLSITGDVITFAKNEFHLNAPWGWASNHYDYKVPAKKEAAPPPKAEAPKADILGGNRRVIRRPGAVTEPAPVVAKDEADTAPKADVNDKQPKKEDEKPENYRAFRDAATPVNADEEVEFTPPAGLSRNALKKAYRKSVGFLPDDWADRPTVSVKASTKEGRNLLALKNGASIKKGSVPAVPRTEAAVIKSPDPDLNKPKATEKTPAAAGIIRRPAENVQEHKAPADKAVALAPAEQREKILDDLMVKHHLDKNSRVILKPEEIKALEQKLPSFAEQLGLAGIEDTLGWPHEMRVELCQQYPEAAAVLITNLSNTLALLTAPAAKEEKEPEQKVEEPLKATGTSGARRIIRR